MPHILVSNRYTPSALSILFEELPPAFNLTCLEHASKNELVKKVAKADYLLASGRIHIDREVLDAALILKMVQRTGVGKDTIDIKALNERGVPFYVNSGVNSRSVAEHTIMLILAVLRQLPLADTGVKNGKWYKRELGMTNRELYGKTVGLVGFGSIGAATAKILASFGVRIFYNKVVRLSREEEDRLGLVYLSLNQLLQNSDILSLHCPLTPKTKALIGASEMAMMKPGSIIVNTSRGGVVDEDALISNLKSGHLGGAGLDVYSVEPPSRINPLLTLDNVVLTPHLAGVTKDSFRRMMREAMKNIQRFESGDLQSIEDRRVTG